MRRAAAVLLAAMLLAGGRVRPASAVVTGAIFGPGSQSFPIAVSPPRALGGGESAAASTSFAAALSRDLELSGYFKLIDPKTFIENPQSSGTTAAEIDFVGWAAIGAQALVKGTAEATGDRVVLEVRLFDVPGRHEIASVSKRFTGSPAEVPRMAHKTADAILEFVTGERGPFDSAIALVSNRDRLKDIYRLTFDQEAPVRMTEEHSLVVNPRWRPDGRAILFTSYRQHFPRLFSFDLATRRVAAISAGNVVLDGAWSPDGTKLLVTREEAGNADIFLVGAGGEVLRRLTDHWAIDVAPAWAPDGRRFAFCSARAGSPQVYVMNIDGSGLARVSHSGSYNTSPAWSPKGDRLAWTARAGGGFQIVVAGVDGSGPATITSRGSNENPSWAPDGRYLVFSTTYGGGHHLMIADRDGKTVHELTHGNWDDTSPAWSPRLE